MAKTVTMRFTFIRTAVLAVSAVVALLTCGHCDASCGEYVYSRFRTTTHKVPEVRRHDSLNALDFVNSGLLRSSEVRTETVISGARFHRARHVTNVPHVRKTTVIIAPVLNGVLREDFPPLPLPCNGPGCSQNPTPSLPVAPQTTIGISHQDRLISGQPDVELPSEVSDLRHIKDLARALRGFPLLIEMPPEFVG